MIRLCGVRAPDGRTLFGGVAAVELALDGEGEVVHFAVNPVGPPVPR